MGCVEGPDRTKRQRKGQFALCLSRDTHLLLSSNIGMPGSRAFEIRPGLNAIRSLGSLALGLGLDLDFPGPPASRQQTVELPSLHNCVSQSLRINVFLSLCTYLIGSVSLENPH